MAQVKLLFQGLSNATNLFQFISPPSALLSLTLSDDRTQDTVESAPPPLPPSTQVPRRMLRWHHDLPVLGSRERPLSLRCWVDEENDFQEGGSGSDFVHVLQLQEQVRVSDLETVMSQVLSEGSLQGSWTSDLCESIMCSKTADIQ